MSQLIYRGNEYIFHEPSEEMLFRTHCVLTAEPPPPSLPLEVLWQSIPLPQVAWNANNVRPKY